MTPRPRIICNVGCDSRGRVATAAARVRHRILPARSQAVHRNRRHHTAMASHQGRILVVDDEQSIVDAVATALRYEGYDVEEAATGRGALDAVLRDEPDLVVLDWMLPDIEGIEVGRR